MDANSLIENTLFLSSIKKGNFNYSFSPKYDLNEENIELSPILFEYILFKTVITKFHNNAEINKNITIISEEFINQNEHFLDIQKDNSLLEKIFLIPYLDNFEQKWGLIIFFNLFSSLPPKNKEIIAKIFISNKNENNLERFIMNIITKLNKDIHKDKVNIKTNIFDTNIIPNTSKFFLCFIDKLFEQKAENTFDYITKIFDTKEKKIKEILSENNEKFNELIQDYYNHCNTYLKSKNSKNPENVDINEKNEKKEEKDDQINEDNINNENVDDLDELAKKVAKDIMNLGIDKSRKKKEKEKNKYKISKDVNVNDLERNKHKKIRDNEEEEDKKEENEKNVIDNIFDLNYNQSNNENSENKKIDEVTKNTIDDILDSVLKDMKTTKDKYKKKYLKKNNKINKIFRLKTINIDHKIDIIEEEDKESSTSEILKEIIKSDKKENEKTINNQEEMSNKLNNSIDIERRPSNFSYNKENYDDTKIKDGEIDFEDQNFPDKKTEEIIKEYKKGKIFGVPIKNKNKDNNMENKNDSLERFNIKKLNNENKLKKEDIENYREKEIKIEKENKINIINNDLEINDSNSNNENLTISNNNSVIENNNIDNNYNEMDILNKNLISLNSNNNYGINYDNNIKIRSDSPKDNKRHNKINNSFNKNIGDTIYKIPNSNSKTICLSPIFTFNNIMNNNNINNININTINAKNIIIINNTILNHNKNKNKIKKNEVKIEKEPEDEKIPKDNRKKIKISEKEPSDGNKFDNNNSKLLTNNLYKKNSKYVSNTINIDRQVPSYNLKNNNFTRSYSALDNFRKNNYENYYNNENNKPYNNINPNALKDNYFERNLQNKYDLKTCFISHKPIIDININNKFNTPIIINKYSSRNERIKKNKKINIYNDLNNKNINNSKKNIKLRTDDFIGSKGIKKNSTKVSSAKNLNHKLLSGKNRSINEDTCIII